MSARGITDELVQRVADDLRARYGLDDEDVRLLGSRLAGTAGARSAENLEFAKRFTDEHRATFDRLRRVGGRVPPRWQPSLVAWIRDRTSG